MTQIRSNSDPGGICGQRISFRIGPEDLVSGRVLRDRYDKILRPFFILQKFDLKVTWTSARPVLSRFLFYQTSEEWRRAGGSYRIYRAIMGPSSITPHDMINDMINSCKFETNQKKWNKIKWIQINHLYSCVFI
jgi:hypothetical protein